MKFSICNELFEGWQIEDVFRTAAELGYEGVEIAPFTLADSVEDIPRSRRREIVKAADSNGVEIVGLHWLLVKPEGLYINHPDEAIRRRTREYLDALIRFCGDVGGRVLVFGSPKQRNVHESLTYEQAWEYARETFAHCAETAGDAGVYLCIEALPARETNFINTVAEAVRMVHEVNKPHFRTMLDVKSMCSEGKPVPRIIEEAGELVMHVHANDAGGRGPGAGDTDFREIAAALRKIGFDGYVSVEVFDFKPDPLTIAVESLEYLKKTFGSG
ncbi:MAG TPA: sugar phosphate isomerase/epimerase family protein [Armatimonadota bacterium]|nr:sugar phosphate isomerase/epimerase family protein [Armatimonadota bacterium]